MAPHAMAKGKAALSLDDMLQADRKKRKAESLAQEIFGKNRRDSTQSSGRNTPLAGGSLASRIGIHKQQHQQQRSASSSSLSKSRADPKLPARGPLSLTRAATAHQLETAIQDERLSSVHGHGRRKPTTASNTGRKDDLSEISIRGAAGPYTVTAQNFAPGTTAADIESVVQPIGGAMLSCRLVSAKPTVIAELVFVDKTGAENVISTFHNKKADGRMLHVYMKESGPVVASVKPAATVSSVRVVSEPAPDLDMDMDMDMDIQAQPEKIKPLQEDRNKENTARARRDEKSTNDNSYDRRGNGAGYQRDAFPRASYQDGRYGFGGITNNDSTGSSWNYRRDDRNGGWNGVGQATGGGGGGRHMYSDQGGRRGPYHGGRW